MSRVYIPLKAIAATTILFIAVFSCPRLVAEEYDITLPESAAFGGQFVRISYTGEAIEFIVHHSTEPSIRLSAPFLLSQIEYLYLPASSTPYSLVAKSQYPLLFRASDVGVEVVDETRLLKADINQVTQWKEENWVEDAAKFHQQPSCVVKKKMLNDLLEQNRLEEILAPSEQPQVSAFSDQCGIYPVFAAEAYFRLMNFEEASRGFKHTQSQSWMSSAPPYDVAYVNLMRGFSDILRGDERADMHTIYEGWEFLQYAKSLIEAHQLNELLPELHNARATYFRVTGDLVAAADELDTAIAVSRAFEKYNHVASYLNNLAVLHRALGNLAAAQRTYSQSIQLARMSNDALALTIQHDNLASTYIELGDLPAAARYFSYSVDINIQMGRDAYTAEALLGLADIALAQGNAGLADTYLNQAQPIITPTSFRESSQYHTLRSAFYAETKQPNKAKQAAALAFEQVAALSDTRHKMNVLFTLARSAIAIQEVEMAEVYLQSALAYIKPKHPHLIEYYELKNALFLQHAKPLTESQKATVENNFTAALSLVNEVENTLSIYRLGPTFKNKVRLLIDSYVEYLLADNSNTSAQKVLEVMDNYQSSMLRKSRQFYSQYGQDIALEENNTTAEMEVNLLSVGESNLAAQAQIDISLEKRDALRAHGRQVSLDVDRTHAYQFERLIDKLQQHEALVRLIDLPKHSHLIVGTKQGWRRFSIGKNMREKLHQQEGVVTWIKADELLPLEYFKSQSISKLILVSDHLTHTIAFSALPMPDNATHVIDHFEVVRAFSVLDYFNPVPSSATQGSHIAVFANPRFNSPASGISNKATLTWRKAMPPLVFSEREASSIQQHFSHASVVTALGAQANSDVLMSDEFGHAKLLHIATHGFYDPEYPGIVGLVTSDAATRRYLPGFVSLTQLLSRPFSADLVVLSGCDTLRGEIWLSEGQNSLSRGMLAQGAGSVLGTLWKVPDRATATFMEHFYASLATTHNASRALQIAKQKMKRNPRFRSPRYWGAFVLTVAHQKAEAIKF